MTFVKITADIHSTTQGETYRIYVGSDLMTERTFVWDPAKDYVEEHIIIEANSITGHEVIVRSVSGANCFYVRNVTAINI